MGVMVDVIMLGVVMVTVEWQADPQHRVARLGWQSLMLSAMPRNQTSNTGAVDQSWVSWYWPPGR